MKKTNQKAVKASSVIHVLLIIALAISLTACQSKEPVTAEFFIEKVEALGYQALDVTDQYDESSHVLKVVNVEYGSIHIDFVEIDGTDNATGVFNTNKTTVESYKGSTSSVSTGKYDKYTMKTSEKYYIVERVGTTVIYAYCDKSESESLDNIIKELGY